MGAWAESFHIEDGSIVEFRATSTGGDTDLSSQYHWPEGPQASQPRTGATDRWTENTAP